MTYRNPDLLALARKAPNCMSCGRANDGDVVAAHSNQYRDGKGRGLKASDARIAYCCAGCHRMIDEGSTLTREARVDLWEAAHRKTIGWLFEAGHLMVALEAVQPERKPPVKARVRKGRKLATGRKIQSNPNIPSRRFDSNRRQEKS